MGFTYKPQVGLPMSIVLGLISFFTAISQNTSGIYTVPIVAGAVASGLAMGVSYYSGTSNQAQSQPSAPTT